MIATLEAQVRAMSARYPQLVADLNGRQVVWQGALRPLLKTYEIRVRYILPQVPEAFRVIDVQPRVHVLNPLLERHSDYVEGPIPHVYWGEDPVRPALCLFDPYVPEWTICDLIAETTIPWTERWLINYEFWLATKVWQGGGRHIARIVRDEAADLSKDKDDAVLVEEHLARKTRPGHATLAAVGVI